LDGLLAALKAEWFVALRSNGSRLVVLLPALVVMARLLLVKLTEAGAEARQALVPGAGFADSGAGAGNAYGYLVDGLGTGLTLASLALVALAAHSFAYDRDTGLLRHLLIRRCSRWSVVTAKLIHLHVLALLSLLLLLLCAWLGAGWLWDYGPVVEDGYELIGTAEIHREIRLGLQLALLPLPAAMAFGLLISVAAQSAAQALSLALGLTLAMDIFKSLMGDVTYYLYATFQPSLVDQSYLREVGRIVRGYSDVLIDERILQLNTWVPLPEMAALLVLTLVLVRRSKL
jgi:ABC-type transport system involved in multi-copper enzyme maturation permease subunit